METKVCNKCNQEQSIDNFHKKYGKPREVCKACWKIYHRAHYLKNKQVYIDKAKIRQNKLKEFVNQLKSNPCVDCGIQWPPIAMDFDHTKDNKKAGIAQMVTLGNKRKILEEVAKCDLVCACCHRVRTSKRLAGIA